jgi:hypothetical protein
MYLDQLFVYPIKSTRGISVSQIEVTTTGFFHDREFAVMNADQTILTAREKPELLKIEVALHGETLKLSAEGQKEIHLNYAEVFQNDVETTLFEEPTSARAAVHSVNEWLSEFLQEPCTLVAIDEKKSRFSTKTEAKTPITFSDSCQVHLVNTASLEDLNEKLQKQVNIDRFRPNIVIAGKQAYEEEKWKRIQIGECLFEIVTSTKRCTLITIDPETAEKDKNQEPLRKLATYKKDEGGVNFGVYLVPITTGTIKRTDKVIINP